VTRAAALQQLADVMGEDELQRRVLAMASELGWLAYHTRFSVGSQAGFPDLVLVHTKRRRVLYRELKRQRTTPTARQQAWLDALTQAGQDAGVWRPLDLVDGSIARELAWNPR
jgi:hypothetical protein